MQIPTISTARLKMRAPIEADTPHYVAFYADAGASKFYGGPLSPVAAWNKLASRSRSLAAERLRNMDDRFFRDGWVCWRLRTLLAYWLASAGIDMVDTAACQAKRHCRRSVRAAMDWAFANGWAEVQTHMRDENLPARRLVEALGGQNAAERSSRMA